MTILINWVSIVFWRYVAGLTGFTIATERHCAATDSVVPASCLVNWTSFISDIIFMNPLVCVVSVPAMATIVFLFTRNQNLRSDVDVWPGSSAVNFDSIGECWRRSLGPTRATVLWNVLVFNIGQIIDTVNVAPVKRLRKLVCKVSKGLFNVKSNISRRLIARSIVRNSSSVCGCNKHDCNRFHE